MIGSRIASRLRTRIVGLGLVTPWPSEAAVMRGQPFGMHLTATEVYVFGTFPNEDPSNIPTSGKPQMSCMNLQLPCVAALMEAAYR